MNPVLSVRNLRKRFKDVEALGGVSFDVQPGQVVALMGPNGSGKSTLMRILATLLQPSDGQVKIQGFDLLREPARVREQIGFLPQEGFLSYALTGMENLMFYARLLNLPMTQARRRCTELLKRFGVAEVARKRVGYYSGGMRRKLALACTLLVSRPLLLLDEPTTGLDPIARRELLGLLLENIQDSSVLLATHIGEDAEIASQILFIHKGRIVDTGSSPELKKKYVRSMVLHIQLPAKLTKVEDLLKAYSAKGIIWSTDRGYRIYPECSSVEEIQGALAGIGLPVNIEQASPSLEDAFAMAVMGG